MLLVFAPKRLKKIVDVGRVQILQLKFLPSNNLQFFKDEELFKSHCLKLSQPFFLKHCLTIEMI